MPVSDIPVNEPLAYRRGSYHVEEVGLATIAKKVGTPFYCYSTAKLKRNYHELESALKAPGGVMPKICYAVKANFAPHVIAALAEEGAGADVVSINEAKLAEAGGVKAENIVFSGVGKTQDEIAEALRMGIKQFNVESLEELQDINDIAGSMQKTANVSLRVNPNVDAHTHAKITTGKEENKFGIAMQDAMNAFRKAASLPNIHLRGISAHIGSQIDDTKPFGEEFDALKTLFLNLKEESIALESIDVGGGIGINYHTGKPALDLNEYGRILQEKLGVLGCELIVEPGRLLVANAGIVVSEVTRTKQAGEKKFAILNAGMNDLIRTALYDAYHRIFPVSEPTTSDLNQPIEMVGPVCESSDTFGEYKLPPLKQGDLVVISEAGAYGAVMSSQYNALPLASEVMVNGDKFQEIRPRRTFEQLLSQYSK